MEFIRWITDPAHLELIFGVWSGLVAVAAMAIRLTPSQKDDKVWSGLGSKLAIGAEWVRNLLTLQKPNAASKDIIK